MVHTAHFSLRSMSNLVKNPLTRPHLERLTHPIPSPLETPSPRLRLCPSWALPFPPHRQNRWPLRWNRAGFFRRPRTSVGKTWSERFAGKPHISWESPWFPVPIFLYTSDFTNPLRRMMRAWAGQETSIKVFGKTIPTGFKECLAMRRPWISMEKSGGCDVTVTGHWV